MVVVELPPEIVTDKILTRLPVKSLLRFRCVSKSWCAHIDSRRFIKSHLTQSIETKTHRNLMLSYTSLYSTDLDSPNLAVELDHPLKCSNFATFTFGSCDGLILLYNCEEDAVIWNPSTRRYQRLLYTEIDYPYCFLQPQYIQYGLGYDSVSDDYKVVKMMQFHGAEPGYYNSLVKIYSLRSNKWKTIDKCPYYLAYDLAYGAFAGGALHWVMTGNRVGEPDLFIAAVDLATEKHQAVPLPDFGKEKFHMNVAVLGGNLCILCHYHPTQARLDVWLMKDYGVKESWTKAFTVWHPKDIQEFTFVRPLAFSKSGREVLLAHDNKKLTWFDLERKVCTGIELSGVTTEFNSLEYVQSLVQLPREETLIEVKSGYFHRVVKGDETKKDDKEKKIVKKRDGFLSKGFKLKL